MDPKTATIVRAEIVLHGWSQAKLCKRLGMSEAQFSLILNGHKPAPAHLAARIYYEIHRPEYEAAGLLPTDAQGQSSELLTAVGD